MAVLMFLLKEKENFNYQKELLEYEEKLNQYQKDLIFFGDFLIKTNQTEFRK